MIETQNSHVEHNMYAINKQIEMIDGSKNILNLGGSIFSNILNKKKITFTEVKPKLNLELHEYIEKLSNEDSWDKELSNLDTKYDVIILDKLLEQTKKPKILFKCMNDILSQNGSLIAHVKNSSYLTNTWKTLGGIFKLDYCEKNGFYNFDLDRLLSFLNSVNFTVLELNRIEKKIQWTPNYAPGYTLPYSLFEILKKDPESEVFSYVFRIKRKNSIDNKTVIRGPNLPKNYFLESLKNKIKSYESSIKPIKKQEKIIDELELSIKETKEKTDLISASKDAVINRLDGSVKKSKNEINKLGKLLDETKEKTDLISASKDAVINSLDGSVKKSEENVELINTTKDVVKKRLGVSEKEINDYVNNTFLKYYKNKSGAKLPDDLVRKGLVEEILHGYDIIHSSHEWLSTLTLAEKDKLIVGLEFILSDYKRLRDALIQSRVYRLTKKFMK